MLIRIYKSNEEIVTIHDRDFEWAVDSADGGLTIHRTRDGGIHMYKFPITDPDAINIVYINDEKDAVDYIVNKICEFTGYDNIKISI